MTRPNRCFSPVVVVAVVVFALLGSSAAVRADGPAAASPPPDVSRTLALTALPRELVEYRQFHEKLHGINVTFAFRGQPVAEAVEFLVQKCAVNIVLDANKLADPNQTITLKLTDAPLDAAVDFLAEQLGLKWDVRNGVVFISDEESIQRPPVTAVYNVRDLMKETKFPVRPGEERQGPHPETILPEEALVMLIDVIKMNIAPGTWEEGSGNAITGVPAQACVVVTHSIPVHAKVQELLELLRRARDLATTEAPRK